jgi:ABC-2 type transport system permease protein
MYQMHQLPIFWGVLRYEFRMQIRRPALWITMALIAALIIGTRGTFEQLWSDIATMSVMNVIGQWTFHVNYFFPVGVGVLLADRFPHDRRSKVGELFWSLPGKFNVRLIGKYFGAMLATLIPVLAFYAIGIGIIAYQTQNLLVIPLAIEEFAAIALPGILFISAFSIACPAILWVPLYQFLFVGYWFWGNLLVPRFGIPTLSRTILTPVGGYMATGFFGTSFAMAGATPLQGIESLLLLLGISVLVMLTLWSILTWKQAHQ